MDWWCRIQREGYSCVQCCVQGRVPSERPQGRNTDAKSVIEHVNAEDVAITWRMIVFRKALDAGAATWKKT